MTALRSYILSVVTAAILCSLVLSIAGKKSSAAPILKLLSGLLLSLTIIRPVAQVKVEDFLAFAEEIQLEAENAAAAGSTYYRDSVNEVILEQTQTYILEKAQTLDASIAVEVFLDETSIPHAVTVRGTLSQKVKEQLEAIIASDIGIPKERQTWIESCNG